MTQKAIAELYQTTPQNITLHIKNIYEEGELEKNSTCKNYLQVRTEGNRRVQRNSRYYNLERGSDDKGQKDHHQLAFVFKIGPKSTITMSEEPYSHLSPDTICLLEEK